MNKAFFNFLHTQLPTDRIYRAMAPEGAAYPYGVYTQVSATENQDDFREHGELRFTYQIDIYADDDATATAMAERVRAAVDLPGECIALGDYDVIYMRAEPARDFSELELDGGAGLIVRKMIEIEITADWAGEGV